MGLDGISHLGLGLILGGFHLGYRRLGLLGRLGRLFLVEFGGWGGLGLVIVLELGFRMSWTSLGLVGWLDFGDMICRYELN